MAAPEMKSVSIHGRSVAYIGAGEGPVLLLIHAMAGTCESWREVIEPLARGQTLLLTLGHDRATVLGHSLGGGVAMQFAYQYPEMIERLVLVSSGGLGPEVSPVLRAAALPGADLFIGATAGPGARVGPELGKGLAAIGLRPDPDVTEVARNYASLSDPDRRAAFLATVRAVIGTGGQRIDAADHVPQIEAPGRFIIALERFLRNAEPARFDADEWRARLRIA